MMNPLLSVIVPIYNAEYTLKDCVGSILSQDYASMEILLVNDGSTDSSLQLCNELRQQDSRIIVIDQPNGGPNSARNKGIERAKGEYIVFVDADDAFFSVDTLSGNTLFLEQNPEIDMVSFPRYRESDVPGPLGRELQTKPEQFTPQLLTDKRTIFINWFNGRLIDCGFPGKIYRKSLFAGWKLIETIRFTEDDYEIPNICRRCRNVQISGVGGYIYKSVETSAIHTRLTDFKRYGWFMSQVRLLEYFGSFDDVEEYKSLYYGRAIENAYYLAETSYCKSSIHELRQLKCQFRKKSDKPFVQLLMMLTSVLGFKFGFKVAKAIAAVALKFPASHKK